MFVKHGYKNGKPVYTYTAKVRKERGADSYNVYEYTVGSPYKIEIGRVAALHHGFESREQAIKFITDVLIYRAA